MILGSSGENVDRFGAFFSMVLFAHLPPSLNINDIRVIRRECGSFWSLLLNGFICTPASLTEYKCIYHWGPIMLTQKCNGKMWLEKMCVHYKNIECILLCIRNQDISFVPYPLGTIFRYFYEASSTFDSIMPLDYNLTQKLVQTACTSFWVKLESLYLYN